MYTRLILLCTKHCVCKIVCRNHLKPRMVSFSPRDWHWLPSGAWEHWRLRALSAPFQGLTRVQAVLWSLDELVHMWLIPAPGAQPFRVPSLRKCALALNSAPVTLASGAILSSQLSRPDLVTSLGLSPSYLLPHKSSLSSQKAFWRCF